MGFLNKTNILPNCEIESISNKYSMSNSSSAVCVKNCSGQCRCQCTGNQCNCVCSRCKGCK